ncbi:hypothetical protein L6452_41903 [Arctium lappa]|uniref:Uncharacterized protein n=1 Tax=Arctium lappa TaxID=4217 RepID=A0ACB8XH98_ARCLA|nr:hypothetical protein L6452_41903 [Arctium lappa]
MKFGAENRDFNRPDVVGESDSESDKVSLSRGTSTENVPRAENFLDHCFDHNFFVIAPFSLRKEPLDLIFCNYFFSNSLVSITKPIVVAELSRYLLSALCFVSDLSSSEVVSTTTHDQTHLFMAVCSRIKKQVVVVVFRPELHKETTLVITFDKKRAKGSELISGSLKESIGHTEIEVAAGALLVDVLY